MQVCSLGQGIVFQSSQAKEGARLQYSKNEFGKRGQLRDVRLNGRVGHLREKLTSSDSEGQQTDDGQVSCKCLISFVILLCD